MVSFLNPKINTRLIHLLWNSIKVFEKVLRLVRISPPGCYPVTLAHSFLSAAQRTSESSRPGFGAWQEERVWTCPGFAEWSDHGRMAFQVQWNRTQCSLMLVCLRLTLRHRNWLLWPKPIDWLSGWNSKGWTPLSQLTRAWSTTWMLVCWFCDPTRLECGMDSLMVSG